MSTGTMTDSRTSLADVRRIVSAWCDDADPALHTGADAARAVEELAVLIRQMTAKQAGFGARVEECHSHSKRFASSDDYLARVNGTSRGEAKRAIDTARRLKACPTAQQAFDRGDLSVAEANAIVGAAALDPSAEGDLVTAATTTHDLVDVRQRADKVKAAARNGEDPAGRRTRLRARRRWSEFDDDEMRAVAARFLPEEWAQVLPVVDAYAEAVYQRARKLGSRDPLEAYRADAVLAALAAAGEALGDDTTRSVTAETPVVAAGTAARHAAGCDAGRRATDGPALGSRDTDSDRRDPAARDIGSRDLGAPDTDSDRRDPVGGDTSSEADCDARTDAHHANADAADELAALLEVRPERVKWNLVLLVDAIALQRGYATATETCEVVGLGPINVGLARQILPEALVDVLVHDLVDIRAHATMTRHQKKALRAALKARDRRCVVPGCKRRRRLQADHRHDFAKRGPTAYQNMELLCQKHHDEKTHRGARIERVGDEWHWYPPPPVPGEPEPPPGSIPWRAPVGEHLTGFDLEDLPPPPCQPGLGDTLADARLPFG